MTPQMAEWIASRPASVQALIRRFPPGCTVVASRSLICPRPDATAWVYSYTEEGRVSVVGEGIPGRVFCDPDALRLVGWRAGCGVEDVAHLLDNAHPPAGAAGRDAP